MVTTVELSVLEDIETVSVPLVRKLLDSWGFRKKTTAQSSTSNGLAVTSDDGLSVTNSGNQAADCYVYSNEGNSNPHPVIVDICGIIEGVLSGATPGQVYYNNGSGGFTNSLPGESEHGKVIQEVGFALNETDLVFIPSKTTSFNP